MWRNRYTQFGYWLNLGTDSIWVLWCLELKLSLNITELKNVMKDTRNVDEMTVD